MTVAEIFQFGVPTGILLLVFLGAWRIIPPYIERQNARADRRDQLHETSIAALVGSLANHETKSSERHEWNVEQQGEHVAQLVKMQGTLDGIRRELQLSNRDPADTLETITKDRG